MRAKIHEEIKCMIENRQIKKFFFEMINKNDASLTRYIKNKKLEYNNFLLF